MTSATPSPSASELAAFQDMLGSAPGLTRDWNEKCKQTAALLRRISDTERERDDLRERETILREDQRKLDAILDYLGIAASELDPVGFLRDLVAQADLATAERDRLREMLAQADAALSVWNAAPGCEDVAEADCDAWTEEACERHRLSQKGR